MKKVQANTAGQIQLPVSVLNENLGCTLCNGYFREAHTISECLHTFCKVCLQKHFSKKVSSHSCPTCKANLGPSPWTKVIFDRLLQAIVDKIFPHFAEAEKTLSLENEKADDAVSRKRPRPDETDADSMTIRVLPIDPEKLQENERLPMLTKPLLKALATVKISKVQKFIQKRLVGENVIVDAAKILIFQDDRLLDPELDLASIAVNLKSEDQLAVDTFILTYKKAAE